jgi:putative endonuclease
MSTVDVGTAAESRAALHLERLGYRIVHRNYRIRGGEIDLIALDRATLCFIEVRSRADTFHGRAEETITPAKQRRLILAAQHYLAGHPHSGPCRFDVIAINGPGLTLIPDAFRLG